VKGYWLKFTDGSNGYCQGENESDAKRIAEKLTGKTLYTSNNYGCKHWPKRPHA